MSTPEGSVSTGLSPGFLREIQRRMLLIRLFDQRACDLLMQGHVPGVLHTSTNQEAAVVGATMALREDDYMTGNHRSHGHPIGKGAHVRGLMAELLGKRTGTCRGKGGSMHLADFSVGSLGESGIVGSGVPVAVGAALSASVRGTDQVALAFFGDGGANSGAVHEAMNLASVWKLPAIFYCENNGFAVTVSTAQSTSVEDISVRGAGYSMPGITVDGQDPLAVYEVTAEAVARARRGDGPSLIEAKTYRTREHAEGLFLSYRDQEEIDAWRARDPIEVFGSWLVDHGVLTADEMDAMRTEAVAEIEDAVAFALESEFPAPEEAFEDMYSNPLPTTTMQASHG